MRIAGQGRGIDLLSPRFEETHSVEFEGFDPAEIRGAFDQISTTEDPAVDCVRQVDFR